MSTYRVTAKRWAHGWELDIEGIGVTQSRTLAGAEKAAREYLSLDFDLPPDSFNVEIVPEIEGGLVACAEAARAETKRAEEAQARAAVQQREVARQLQQAGLSGADVAAVMKLSTQRVSQLIGKPRRSATTGRYTTKSTAARRSTIAKSKGRVAG